ncbi:MAG: hypothetical protein A2Y04_01740 [Omnitrophica WOR_2 bacterium GWC2_45_7]|nr:MAG: hypothetical protein A2Y04_01740 [Omnitrophica WOR_2 bacterium GWC2_45_7]
MIMKFEIKKYCTPCALFLILAFCLTLSSCAHTSAVKSSPKITYQSYIDFFEKVYKTMEDNYYQPVSRDVYEGFIQKFTTKIYGELKDQGKSIDFIRWRSSASLMDNLKSPEDIFSAFYPPEPAKEYEQTALGKRVDLGVEGKLTPEGYLIALVEPRSDAYQQGLRDNDILLRIDQSNIKDLDEQEINELLNPLENAAVSIHFWDAEEGGEKNIQVVSKEYFKQTVFMMPINIPSIYGLEIRRFNRMTAEDLFRFLKFFKENGVVRGLILDLRNNPGGPPLAAREIASFFLPGGEDFAYFQKKGQPKSMLDVPNLPEEFRVKCPMVILVNKESGSASELFSGVLQRRGRAILMGTNSAGQVMLKSMFPMNDQSMMLLVTARGHHPDGGVFSFDGLTPDRFVSDGEQDKILEYATKYLVYVHMSQTR